MTQSDNYCVNDTDGDGNCHACAHNPTALCRKPRRIPLDELTSDALDQLYTDLETYELVQGEMNERAIDLTRSLARAEAERDRYRAAWNSARDRAQALSEGTLRHVADRDSWKGWTKKAEEAVKYWYDAAVERLERAKRAEAAIERVRGIHARNPHTGDCEHCSAHDYPNYAVPHPCPTIAALAEQQEQPATPAVHIGGNAEDCPACSGTNPPYPFLCPGPTT